MNGKPPKPPNFPGPLPTTEIVKIGGLTPQQLNAATQEAIGESLPAIAQALGVNPMTIRSWRRLPEYRHKIISLRKEIEDRLITKAASLETRLNALAPRAIKTLAYLNDSAESENVRLSAANSILDRAPEAPRRKAEGAESKVLVLQLGAQQSENLLASLKEVGRADLVDMLNAEGALDVSEGAS